MSDLGGCVLVPESGRVSTVLISTISILTHLLAIV